VHDVDWFLIPGPAGYAPEAALAAAQILATPASPGQAARAVADLRSAVSSDHQGTLYPAAVPAVRVFLAVIAAMPGTPRDEALTVLLDWRGMFQPEPGYETYANHVTAPGRITDAITDLLRDAEPVLRQVADDDHTQNRKQVMELLRRLDAGWIPVDLPRERTRLDPGIRDPAWPGTAT
jgi:hypothetical protein